MMARMAHIDETWRRPILTQDDIPQGFVRWWRTVPHERRHIYLYGGLYSLIEAFNQGKRDEVEQLSEQVERLSVELRLALAYVEGAEMDAASRTNNSEAIARRIRTVLRLADKDRPNGDLTLTEAGRTTDEEP